jgi:hypothetical protein
MAPPRMIEQRQRGGFLDSLTRGWLARTRQPTADWRVDAVRCVPGNPDLLPPATCRGNLKLLRSNTLVQEALRARMPRYTFTCESCAADQEIICRASDLRVLRACSRCSRPITWRGFESFAIGTHRDSEAATSPPGTAGVAMKTDKPLGRDPLTATFHSCEFAGEGIGIEIADGTDSLVTLEGGTTFRTKEAVRVGKDATFEWKGKLNIDRPTPP